MRSPLEILIEVHENVRKPAESGEGKQVPERPFVRPPPRSMPGEPDRFGSPPVQLPIPGDGIPCDALPVARLHGAGPRWLRWMIALVVGSAIGVGGANMFLHRIDRAQLAAETARAETRLLRAQVEQHAVAESLRAAITHRDAKPENCELALRRTAALRSAIFALVRTGTAAMPNDPGPDWAMWPQTLEATR